MFKFFRFGTSKKYQTRSDELRRERRHDRMVFISAMVSLASLAVSIWLMPATTSTPGSQAAVQQKAAATPDSTPTTPQPKAQTSGAPHQPVAVPMTIGLDEVAEFAGVARGLEEEVRAASRAPDMPQPTVAKCKPCQPRVRRRQAEQVAKPWYSPFDTGTGTIAGLQPGRIVGLGKINIVMASNSGPSIEFVRSALGLKKGEPLPKVRNRRTK